MRPEDCPFRFDVVADALRESACCRLATDLVGGHSSLAVRVDRMACEACVEQDLVGTLARHPVLPSLLLRQAELAGESRWEQESREQESREQERRERWRAWSEDWVVADGSTASARERLPACDVLVFVDRWLPTLEAALESVLDQRDVVAWLHLVDASAGRRVDEPAGRRGDDLRALERLAAVLNKFAERWNVRTHRASPAETPLEFAARNSRLLASSYLALQTPHGVSDSRRLRFALESLEREGAELAVATLDGGGRPEPALDDETRQATASCDATLIVRRATLVDIGIAHPEALASGRQFVQQAIEDQRELLEDERPRVRLDDAAALRAYRAEASRRMEATGRPPRTSRPSFFPPSSFACDVVLPFHGHLDFAAEALESLLEQSGVDCVIHVIDDASPDSSDAFFTRYRQVKRVRAYRNRENIGQFQSFNQASRFFETEWAVVHDADDVSLPHRLQRTGQLLQYADADFFGGAVEVFGDATPAATSGRTPLRRYSRYPRDAGSWYYAENPTAAFRTSFFRQLGGFADFGDRWLNRASIDTEFQVRSRFSQARFAMTRDIVLRYRVHDHSATQNAATGWGTAARTRAAALVEARYAALARGIADLRSFGSLGRTPAVLERM